MLRSLQFENSVNVFNAQRVFSRNALTFPDVNRLNHSTLNASSQWDAISIHEDWQRETPFFILATKTFHVSTEATSMIYSKAHQSPLSLPQALLVQSEKESSFSSQTSTLSVSGLRHQLTSQLKTCIKHNSLYLCSMKRRPQSAEINKYSSALHPLPQ